MVKVTKLLAISLKINPFLCIQKFGKNSPKRQHIGFLEISSLSVFTSYGILRLPPLGPVDEGTEFAAKKNAIVSSSSLMSFRVKLVT